MRRNGAINVDNYDPAVTDLPQNRKIASILAPFKGQPYTQGLRDAMITALCKGLGIADRETVDKFLQVETKPKEQP